MVGIKIVLLIEKNCLIPFNWLRNPASFIQNSIKLCLSIRCVYITRVCPANSCFIAYWTHSSCLSSRYHSYREFNVCIFHYRSLNHTPTMLWLTPAFNTSIQYMQMLIHTFLNGISMGSSCIPLGNLNVMVTTCLLIFKKSKL